MSGRLPLTLLIFVPVAIAAGCATPEARVPVATLSLEADLPGAEAACFEVVLPGPDDAPSAPRAYCGSVTAGHLAFEVVAPCDPLAPPRAVVRLTDATAAGHLLDPCGPEGCSLALDCDGPPVALRLAFADDDTGVDWVATQVALPDVWLGATLTTCRDAQPFTLLTDEPDGPRRATALVGLAAAAESDALGLALSEPRITCADGARCALSLTEERGRATAVCSDGSAIDYLVSSGTESIDDAWVGRYLTLALDLQDLLDAGHRDCHLDHAATASIGALALGPADTWPAARYQAPLIDVRGAVACTDVSFDDYGHEDPAILAIDFLRGSALSPAEGTWSDLPAPCVRVTGGILTNTCR